VSTLTTRLGLTKPASSENISVTTLDDNFDLVDAAVAATVAASSARPASAFNGRLFYATDSNKFYVNEAANASTVASWSDPVADALGAIQNLSVGGALTIGNGLTVSAGKGYRTYVRKSASESLASDTTLQNDNHITFTLAASAVYQLTSRLAVNGPTAGDFKTAWVFTGPASGGSHGNRYCDGPATSVSAVTDTGKVGRSTAWTTSVSYGTDGSLTSAITEAGLLDTTAGGSGTITLQWAQNASNATSTVVGTSSYAILERLA
jgi:hypothetical protein